METSATFFCQPLGRRRLENRCFATRCHGGDQKRLVLPAAILAGTKTRLFCPPPPWRTPKKAWVDVRRVGTAQNRGFPQPAGNFREVLECGGPPPLFRPDPKAQSGGGPPHSQTLARGSAGPIFPTTPLVWPLGRAGERELKIRSFAPRQRGGGRAKYAFYLAKKGMKIFSIGG